MPYRDKEEKKPLPIRQCVGERRASYPNPFDVSLFDQPSKMFITINLGVPDGETIIAPRRETYV